MRSGVLALSDVLYLWLLQVVVLDGLSCRAMTVAHVVTVILMDVVTVEEVWTAVEVVMVGPLTAVVEEDAAVIAADAGKFSPQWLLCNRSSIF